MMSDGAIIAFIGTFAYVWVWFGSSLLALVTSPDLHPSWAQKGWLWRLHRYLFRPPPYQTLAVSLVLAAGAAGGAALRVLW